VWPNVFGWCILNTSITYIVWSLKHDYDYDVTFASTGHDLLSLLISFLVVSHVSTAYARFWEARDYLARIFSSCRKLSQKVAIYTMDMDPVLAEPYRASVKKWLLELMTTSMNVIEDETQALFFAEGTCVESIMDDDNSNASNEKKKILNKRLLGNVRSFRFQQDPLELAGMLQAAIMSHEQVLQTDRMIRFELELLGCVNVFVDSYMQLIKFVTTPIPFPLVQMGRTTLFVWIFSLSGVLVHTINNLLPSIVVIFFITYGFVGLMYGKCSDCAFLVLYVFVMVA
jgi:predicted membrane chloride channel (bestrophin family)